VIAQGGTLRAALAAAPEVSAHLDAAALDALFDLAAHLSASDAMVDLVLARITATPLTVRASHAL